MVWASLPVQLRNVSVQLIRRESVKQLSTTRLNSSNQGESWQSSCVEIRHVKKLWIGQSIKYGRWHALFWKRLVFVTFSPPGSLILFVCLLGACFSAMSMCVKDICSHSYMRVWKRIVHSLTCGCERELSALFYMWVWKRTVHTFTCGCERELFTLLHVGVKENSSHFYMWVWKRTVHTLLHAGVNCSHSFTCWCKGNCSCFYIRMWKNFSRSGVKELSTLILINCFVNGILSELLMIVIVAIFTSKNPVCSCGLRPASCVSRVYCGLTLGVVHLCYLPLLWWIQKCCLSHRQNRPPIIME